MLSSDHFFFFLDALMVGTMKMISQAIDPEISIKWAQGTLTLAALGSGPGLPPPETHSEDGRGECGCMNLPEVLSLDPYCSL